MTIISLAPAAGWPNHAASWRDIDVENDDDNDGDYNDDDDADDADHCQRLLLRVACPR